MDVVNVVMTCEKVLKVPEGVPTEPVDYGTKYYLLGTGVEVTIFNTGKAKVYAKQYPPPSLPYFDDCKIDNIVIRTRIKAIPVEEMVEALDALGFKFGDREKVNALLLYYKKGDFTATIRIFPKADAEEYKVIVFSKSMEVAEEAIRLLNSLAGNPPQGRIP